MSAVTINLPDSLHRGLDEIARAEGISVERLMTSAAAEKLSALLEGSAYLERAAARGSRAAFKRVLAKIPDVEPEEYDRLTSEDDR